jgi:histidine ammonia-lyase
MVTLNGRDLTIEQVQAVALRGEPVQLAPEAIEQMNRSRAVVDRLAGGDDPVYGVNTGVGLLADVRVSHAELEQLQRNVVRSHAAGVGQPLPPPVVRAMMLIRANVLAIGCSGIRPLIAQRLCDLLNSGVTPVVPSKGSVGASGDLAPLAHIALVLMGEGSAEVDGETLTGAEALRRREVEPVVFASKEGLSLINGTQLMLAIGCLELMAAEMLCEMADVACAMSLDALRGTPRAFDARIHKARPQSGQQISAARLRDLLEGSEIRQSHITCRRVQDAYSLRCAPQVHGAVRDTMAEARRVFSIELNSVTDNPIVFGGEIISGGNFHGEPLALNLDFMAIALSALSGISERRVDRLVNPALNEELPPFLADHPGLQSGFMMVQVTAAALVADNRVLSHPASVGSITTSGNKEDFVSMGVTSALKLRQVVENTTNILAIEMITAARALDCLRPLQTSPQLEAVREGLRMAAGEWRDDQPFSDQIEAVALFIASAQRVT